MKPKLIWIHIFVMKYSAAAEYEADTYTCVNVAELQGKQVHR